MKKTLSPILTVGVWVASADAQGSVTFNNSATSIVYRQVYLGSPDLIPMPVGGGHVELLWAEFGTADLSLFSSVAITDFHTAPGRFNGGVVTVPLTTPGGGASFYIRGWTGTSLTWAGVYGSDLTGASTIFTVAATGNPTTVPPGTPPSMSQLGFTGLTLGVPEPSSMALAGLGTVSLLLFRRRVPARQP